MLELKPHMTSWAFWASFFLNVHKIKTTTGSEVDSLVSNFLNVLVIDKVAVSPKWF